MGAGTPEHDPVERRAHRLRLGRVQRRKQPAPRAQQERGIVRGLRQCDQRVHRGRPDRRVLRRHGGERAHAEQPAPRCLQFGRCVRSISPLRGGGEILLLRHDHDLPGYGFALNEHFGVARRGVPFEQDWKILLLRTVDPDREGSDRGIAVPLQDQPQALGPGRRLLAGRSPGDLQIELNAALRDPGRKSAFIDHRQRAACLDLAAAAHPRDRADFALEPGLAAFLQRERVDADVGRHIDGALRDLLSLLLSRIDCAHQRIAVAAVVPALGPHQAVKCDVLRRRPARPDDFLCGRFGGLRAVP